MAKNPFDANQDPARSERLNALGVDLLRAAKLTDYAEIVNILSQTDVLEGESWRSVDEFNLTALMAASLSKSETAVECVRLLAGRGLVRAKSKQSGWTALMLAAGQGTEATVELLIPLSDLNAVNAYGRCALMNACAHSRIDTARLLIKACPERVKALDPSGVDALMIASEQDAALTRELLASGANPLRRDQQNCTALMRAVSAENEGSAAALLAAGAQPLARSKGGVTLLMKAAGVGSMGCVKLLVPYGGLNSVDDQGRDASGWARARAHKGVALWLEEASRTKMESKSLRRVLRQVMSKPEGLEEQGFARPRPRL